ncbi:dephospho-CoA kinase [Pyramidobacter piscolens]|uniref:dephospho-CoA kinase n=1 Tax=Pyramidobacter piscolens TaxID=638849 RepID=UPI0028E78BE3|nr:dephospho-CoA kinase [Pyramidobacter piscolens]
MATVVIALTGEPGAGKSTAAQWFRARGAALLDADGIVRRLWDGGELPQKARARWGGSVFGADGKIDRKAVSARVFADEEEYRWLCRATHPVVLSRMEAALPEEGVVVAEIPMLFEAGRPDWVDKVLFMAADPRLRAERNRFRGFDETELARRERFFMDRERRMALSDWVLCNDGSVENLEAQLEKIWREIQALRSRREAQTDC